MTGKNKKYPKCPDCKTTITDGKYYIRCLQCQDYKPLRDSYKVKDTEISISSQEMDLFCDFIHEHQNNFQEYNYFKEQRPLILEALTEVDEKFDQFSDDVIEESDLNESFEDLKKHIDYLKALIEQSFGIEESDDESDLFVQPREEEQRDWSEFDGYDYDWQHHRHNTTPSYSEVIIEDIDTRTLTEDMIID